MAIKTKIKIYGLTLIELLIVIFIMSLVTGAIYTVFKKQYWSSTRESNIIIAQENAQTILEIIRQDLMMAGWGLQNIDCSLYIEDGGNGNPDKLYINYWNLLDENDAWNGYFSDITFLGSGSSSITLSTFDLDNDGTIDFTTNMYIITNANSNKVAKISSLDSSNHTLNLSTNVDGSYLTPAIYYCLNCGGAGNDYILRRSDRNSGGLQPLAENIVDFQIAYSDRNGTWYCDGSANCPMSPFETKNISLVRVTVIARTKALGAMRGSSRIVQAENGNTWGTTNDGFVYRAYSITIAPKHLKLFRLNP